MKDIPFPECSIFYFYHESKAAQLNSHRLVTTPLKIFTAFAEVCNSTETRVPAYALATTPG